MLASVSIFRVVYVCQIVVNIWKRKSKVPYNVFGYILNSWLRIQNYVSFELELYLFYVDVIVLVSSHPMSIKLFRAFQLLCSGTQRASRSNVLFEVRESPTLFVASTSLFDCCTDTKTIESQLSGHLGI